jgi:hypothetical protein
MAAFYLGVLQSRAKQRGNMSYIITGMDSAGALSLKRDSAAAAIKKANELMDEGCRQVCITDPDGRVYPDAEFSLLSAAAKTP